MGCSASKQIEWTRQANSPIYGAGCMFINDTHTLAGIHTPRRNHEVRICGFGGKAEGEEPWWQTAFRETIEEFFHVTSIPNTLFRALQSLQPIRILRAEDPVYITLVYSFAQLKTFLKLCANHITSPLYTNMPKTVEDLVFRRQFVGNAGAPPEIMHIVFWPLQNPYRRFRITKDFLSDMHALTV